MASPHTPPAEPIAASPKEAAPSLAVTVLLILSWLALWLAVFWACLILLLQRTMAQDMKMQVPGLVDWLWSLSWWDWFSAYGGWIQLGAIVLAAVVGLLTYWVRHRRRSRLAAWAWGALLILPPLLLLAILAPSSILAASGLRHALRAAYEGPEDYLTADRRQLLSPLKLRETRRALTGPEGEILVIEPGGDWRVVPGIHEWERPPLRQGKLTPPQLAMLAEQLASVRFRHLCEWEEGLPAFPEPPPNRDTLRIEFGDRHLTLEHVRRQRMLQDPGMPQEIQLEVSYLSLVRIASLVLFLEDLVKPDRPD
jgi:hypothetical protein